MNKKIYITLFLIFVLSLIPFLILNYFNQPTSEDFYYSGELFNIGFSKTFRTLYNFWGGRYFGYLFVIYNPLSFGSVSGYKFATLLMMIILFAVFFMFVSRFTGKVLNFKERLLTVLAVTFVYLYAAPSVAQGFYWLISVLFYNVGVILSMLFLMLYSVQLRSGNPRSKIFLTLPGVILIAAITGSCEIVAGTLFLILGSVFILEFIKSRSVNFLALFYTLVSLAGVLFVNSAPGNVLRSSQYPANHDFAFSFSNALSFTSVKLLDWTFITPLIFVTFLLIPYFRKITVNENADPVFKINPVFSVLMFAVLLFVNSFLILWSIGEVPYDRILNFIFMIFIIGWFYNVIVFMNFFRSGLGKLTERIPVYSNAIAAVAVLLFFLKANNINTAYKEIFDGTASGYNQQLNARYEIIRESPSDTVRVDSIENVPKSFFLLDIFSDPSVIYNRGYALYFHKKAVALKKPE
ncbi:MAG: hypothetical protein JSS91_04050 [Bacteroidetes bacterium]|nr:hypothetical protein [Bacteroidota bacterium]